MENGARSAGEMLAMLQRLGGDQQSFRKEAVNSLVTRTPMYEGLSVGFMRAQQLIFPYQFTCTDVVTYQFNCRALPGNSTLFNM